MKLSEDEGRCAMEPAVRNCNASLDACVKGGQWRHALGVYGRMCQEMMDCVLTMSTLAQAGAKDQRWSHAFEVVGSSVDVPRVDMFPL